MSRDVSDWERNERRGFGGPDDWDAERDYGISPYTRDRLTRRSAWQSSPVTSYREAGSQRQRDDWDADDRYRDEWDRDRGYRREGRSRGDDLDRDVFRPGDREQWRGDFGPGEDRTRWGGRRDWDVDRGRRGRVTGGWERGYGRDDDTSDRGRFGSMDDVRVRYGRDFSGERDWDDSDYGWQPYRTPRDGERSRFSSERDWGSSRSGLRSAWPTAGQFTGQGPRGYQRSDERIREEVCELLWQHGEIDASEIDVRVENGEVTLDGTVDSRWTKRMAEDAVHDARGVADVHNRLRVRRDERSGRLADDRAISQRAASGSAIPMGGRTVNRQSVTQDMIVVGADGDEIGNVKEVRGQDFLIDRPLARDIYAPFSAVETTDGTTIRLNIRSGEIDNQGWQQPSMTGTDSDYNQRVDMT